MQEKDMAHYSWIKWLLFVIFLITVPVPFYLLLALGLVPTAAIIIATLGETINALVGHGLGGVFCVVMGVQAVIFGGILYLAALALARILCSSLAKGYSILLTTVLICSLIVASCFNIYRLPDHDGMLPANLAGAARFVAVEWSGSPFAAFFGSPGWGMVSPETIKRPPDVILYQKQSGKLIKIAPRTDRTSGVRHLERGKEEQQ
jgi:hypothetical protein